MEELLEKIRELFKQAYLEASEHAVDLHRAIDMELLDNANDYKDCFSDDEQKSLNVISTCLWQALVGALRIEGVNPMKDDEAFKAIFEQIIIAHFG